MKEFQNKIMSHPSELLKDILLERKMQKPGYSARAFARDIGLSAAFLSQVMSEKRKLSLAQKMKLSEVLGLVPQKAKTPKMDLIQNTIEHEKIIKYWYHFAILELVTISDSVTTPIIVKRLGISRMEAESAINRLIDFGYLTRDRQKQLKRTKAPFMISVKSGAHVVRSMHQSRLQAAHAELNHFEEPRVEGRYFQTLFLPTTLTKVVAAKKMMSEFQSKLIHFLTEGENDEVFQLGLQLFSAESPALKNSVSKTENAVNDPRTSKEK